MEHKLALIGFGTVGQGFAEILAAQSSRLESEDGLIFRLTAVSDLVKGSVYDPAGLDVDKLLELAKSNHSLLEYPAREGVVFGWNSLETIQLSNADTVVEVSWTDVKTGQPAISHCLAAFAAKKNVVLTNKGPVALAYHDLQRAADDAGCLFRFEGTVMSGTPVIRLGKQALEGCQISEIKGILNGTTNFVLTQMESGTGYAEALVKAQKLGYAEADPTADVEGFDALAKLVILANVFMGANLNLADVPRKGITHLTPVEIATAQKRNERWKLIARVRRDENGKIDARVEPVSLPTTHPLTGVGGVTNAITFTTDLLGDVTVIGPGAGRTQTGFAVLSDVLEIAKAR